MTKTEQERTIKYLTAKIEAALKTMQESPQHIDPSSVAALMVIRRELRDGHYTIMRKRT